MSTSDERSWMRRMARNSSSGRVEWPMVWTLMFADSLRIEGPPHLRDPDDDPAPRQTVSLPGPGLGKGVPLDGLVVDREVALHGVVQQ